jgi:hypothetical protein
MSQITRVARSKKIKKLAISSFKKGQILKNLKGPKRPNFPQIFLKITKLKFRVS